MELDCIQRKNIVVPDDVAAFLPCFSYRLSCVYYLRGKYYRTDNITVTEKDSAD